MLFLGGEHHGERMTVADGLQYLTLPTYRITGPLTEADILSLLETTQYFVVCVYIDLHPAKVAVHAREQHQVDSLLARYIETGE